MEQAKKDWLKNTWIVCLLASACCILWGSAFPCIKLGYRWWHIASESTGSQILFAGCRFTLAGIVTVLIGSVSERRYLIPNQSDVACIMKLSVFQTILQYIFFYIGLANASGVKSSIIEASNVFFAILAASLVFHQEKLTPKKVLGCIAGFTGVILVNLPNGTMDVSMSFKGEGFILFSALAYAVSSALTKRYSAKHDPVLLSGYQFLFGGIVLILWGLASGGRLEAPDGKGIAILIYLACVSAVSYSIWGILLKHNPVSKVTVFGFMNPVAGVFLSALLLQEKNQASGIYAIVALILVCLGIYIVNGNNKITE